jgi:predicted nucleotide-binding protein
MEQKKSKIFIGASEKGQVLAEQLQILLSTESEAVLWSEESKGKISLKVLDMLNEITRDCDFAVIILTRDDVIFEAGSDHAQRQARDNCIYEAGLFRGALKKDR